jgi:hypothetical protein
MVCVQKSVGQGNSSDRCRGFELLKTGTKNAFAGLPEHCDTASGRSGDVEVLEVLCASADATGVRAPRKALHDINVRGSDADLLQHILQ